MADIGKAEVSRPYVRVVHGRRLQYGAIVARFHLQSASPPPAALVAEAGRSHP